MNNRVLFSNNGTLEDFSVSLNNYLSGTKPFNYVAGEDYLFIGARLPFNHIYIKLNKPNTTTVTTKVEYWDGNNWVNTVEVIDETNGFNQSGHIQWTPNKDYQWSMESTNYSGETVTGLEDVVIYDRYWVRVSFNGNFQGLEINNDPNPSTYENVELSWVGNLFSNDSELGSIYPDLVRSTVLDAFKSGKTSWEEQAVMAGEILIQDLINNGIIIEKGQILDWRLFTKASIYKIAEMVFVSFGDDYIDQSKEARNYYKQYSQLKINRIDKNRDAIESHREAVETVGFLTR